ncbi:Phage-related lysozyme (muraminidase) [Klebsiella pneumoniae]|uniref:glycoside hydrolase family 108 protein n=2 Tax=Klebsiella pneumoniae TaxID=573 RepID=UPI0007CC71A9|nr:glycosyl hydrolase 108 family protein [Klebsiella pneumoniae]APQ26219.1 Phage-related lysozyme (muraminidase) [Klebsiella pneumoniae]CAK6154665.1 Phage-related lysozyme (Muraminidase) [Klebsiella pneumoniae]CAK6453610.1 Phage-related lysozyme (Muraminidase) [Klebsiella pneumoniae]CAK6594126.1 Phage-related lysozyme (Muraminidase) [Klebsiella pneumoniae]CAK6595749.1 Phage-related lysozyme (Muraminidase) [Klebsiella pneumoniae]
MKCTSRTDWAYYLSREDVLHYKKAGRLAAGFPLSYEPGNTAQQVIRPGKEPGEAARTFSLVTLGRDKDTLKKGDRVWVVSDGDSLTSVAPAASSSEPVFNDVYVPSAPVPVSAGDSLGHMGFYQLPEENGKRSRYQVHIECLSTDDMEKFITNPGRVGEDAPVYLTWKADAPLSDKSDTGITAGSRKTKAPGILTLANVPGVDAKGKTLTNNKDAAWFQIRPEGGWLPAASVKKVSQYALGELGFVTLNKASESFDLIDGIKQPNNMVKGILEQLYKAAQDETRTTHALNKYNYKRLLELIDSNQDGYYQEQEYLQAVHNISYRDRLYRVIAKHASEWYYGKDAPLWKTYLDTLTRDAPLWKTYLETFLDKMTWMKTVSEKGVALGSEPWHMHPVVFLEAIRIKERCRELFSKISSVILQHEGGYVNDPNDRGGETNMGITIATWRAYAPSDLGIEATTNTLRNMTKEQAEIIYYNHYWEPKGFCKLETIKIALMLYDWTITSGRAVTQVRKMLHNEYNINLVVSNTMDDDMIHCINAIEDQEQLLSRIAEVRKEYYRSLTITNGEPNTQVRFLTGWINRVNDCLRVNI